MKDLQTFRYKSIYGIQGTLIFLRNIQSVSFEEIVKIHLPNGEVRTGQVLQADENATIVQVFEGTESIDIIESEVVFTEDVFKVGVATSMIGRTMNGLGEAIDTFGKIYPDKYLPVSGIPMNPIKREKPENFIETGISTIDGLNSLVEGQKLPIFTGTGLATGDLAASIAVNSRILAEEKELIVIFVAMGITEREGRFFRETFEEASGTSNISFFSNYTQDSIVERLLTPRVALTFAEYLAFEKDKTVLVILQDMLNYAEALREISSAREEFPGRRGYPGYLYTDLATIYERAGKIKGRKGSITLIPIVTMPNDDITHPVPDLSGYITEGQIILSRDLSNKQIAPPINPLLSLSRLMNEGIGSDKTREDHGQLANQLFAAYAKGVKLRQLASIAGKEALSSRDQFYLEFAEKFEMEFINQSKRRTILDTLNLGWRMLKYVPKGDLNRIPKKYIEKYYPQDK